jgi:hypothetical protein
MKFDTWILKMFIWIVMNLYILIFSFIQYPIWFVTNVVCELSYVTKRILITYVNPLWLENNHKD